MTYTLTNFKESFDLKIFLIGLGAVSAFYILIFAYVLINSGATLARLEKSMPVQSALISWPEEKADDSAGHDGSDHNKTGDSHETEQQEDENSPIPLKKIKSLYEAISDFEIPKTDSIVPRSVFDAYKAPLTLRHPDIGKIAIVLDGYGLSEDTSNAILKNLPSSISLILSPYIPNAQAWRNKAAKQGFEVWLNAPIETAAFANIDQGNLVLRSDKGIAQNQKSIYKILSQIHGYAGIAVFSDATITEESIRPMFEDLFSDISKRGIGIFEINPDSHSTIQIKALSHNAPYSRSLFSDKGVKFDGALSQYLEDLALSNPTTNTIIVLDPLPENIKALKTWSEGLDKDLIQLVPASHFSVSQ